MHVAGRWQCMRCLSTALTRDSYARRATQTCPGANRKLVNVVAGAGGHELILGDCGGWPIVACVACGAWATKKCVLLAGQCRGQCTNAGMHALKRLAKGRHPVSQLFVSELWRVGGGMRFGGPQIHLRPVPGNGGGPRLDGGLSAFERLRLRVVAREAAARLEQ